MSRSGPRLSRLGVLAPAALSACIDASVLAAPAAGAIVSTVLKELSKAFMLKKWFHGVMSAREAESLLLQRGKSGSYLVRESRANPGEYVLSVRVRGRVRHVMIRREQNKFDVGSGEIFDDLSGLIEHIRAYPLTETSGEVLRLRQPVGAARNRLNSLTKDQSIAELEIKVVDIKKNSINPHLSATFEEIQIDGTSVHAPTYSSHLLDDLFTEEFEVVKLADEKIWFTKNEGLKLENRYKNRYREIVPYDQTRVLLPVYPVSPDEIVNNYINASYIKPTNLFAVQKQNAVGVCYTDDDYTRAIETKSYTEASQRFERLLTTAANADLDSNQNENDNDNENDNKNDNENEKTKKIYNPNERSLHWDSDELSKFYIAAQGSLASTKEAYWSAIADNDVRVIAMLTKQTENGKSKSEAYWPSGFDRETYGDLEIVNLNEYKKPEESFITRTLEIYNKTTGKETILKHFQYLDWPDHNVPNDTKSLLKFIEAVNEALVLFSQLGDDAPNKNILWVHCSAGIGRTGTFIALDILMDQVKHEMKHKEGVFPVVPATVKMIRWQRPGMVQNRRQYAFIYAALSDFLDDIIAYYDPNVTRMS